MRKTLTFMSNLSFLLNINAKTELKTFITEREKKLTWRKPVGCEMFSTLFYAMNVTWTPKYS